MALLAGLVLWKLLLLSLIPFIVVLAVLVLLELLGGRMPPLFPPLLFPMALVMLCRIWLLE